MSDATAVETKPGVVRRLVASFGRPVPAWMCFVYGVAGPALCFAVEDGRLVGRGTVLPYPSVTLPFVALQCALLVVWVALRRWLGPLNALFGGAFCAGALFALGVGVVLLPFAILLFYTVIGLLGFVPLLTGYAFARAALDAWRRAEHRGTAVVAALSVVGALGAAMPSSAVAGAVARRIKTIAHDLGTYEPENAESDVRRLRWLARYPGASLQPLVDRWEEVRDPDARRRLDDAYKSVAGETIEERLDRLND